MPNMTLSDAVDVICRAGTPKMTKVREIKNRLAYHPALDFYRPLRNGLVALHSGGGNRSGLEMILSRTNDLKKAASYRELIDGYRKWWGRKEIEWFDPPRATYEHSGVSVTVNPELGLKIDGQRFIIKLYMKDEPLLKVRIDPATVLMEIALRPVCQDEDLVAFLDVRKGKLHVLGVNVQRHTPMVNGELAYIAALWPDV